LSPRRRKEIAFAGGASDFGNQSMNANVRDLPIGMPSAFKQLGCVRFRRSLTADRAAARRRRLG
jgi:hypothetical protein